MTPPDSQFYFERLAMPRLNYITCMVVHEFKPGFLYKYVDEIRPV